MKRTVIAKEILKIAKEVMAESWIQVPQEFIGHPDLSGIKVKVMGNTLRTVTEKNDKPEFGRAFSTDFKSGWLGGLGKVMGLPPAKHVEFEKWVIKTFPQVKSQ